MSRTLGGIQVLGDSVTKVCFSFENVSTWSLSEDLKIKENVPEMFGLVYLVGWPGLIRWNSSAFLNSAAFFNSLSFDRHNGWLGS